MEYHVWKSSSRGQLSILRVNGEKGYLLFDIWLLAWFWRISKDSPARLFICRSSPVPSDSSASLNTADILPYYLYKSWNERDDLSLSYDSIRALFRKAVATLIYFRPINWNTKDAYKQQPTSWTYHNGRTNDKTYNSREGVGLAESTGKYWEGITELAGCEIGYFTWREGWASCQGSEAGAGREDQEGLLNPVVGKEVAWSADGRSERRLSRWRNQIYVSTDTTTKTL